jgi:mono/diheme cytochrome c family protein
MNHRIPLIVAAILTLLGCSAEQPEQITFMVDPTRIERGAVVARGLAACGVCHGDKPTPDAPLSGGRAYTDRYGPVAASNITPAESGIAGWRAGEIVRVLRGGPRRDDQQLSSEVHRGYEWMSDSDALAVVSYLLTVPPVERTVPRRDISFMDRNTRGFFDVQREVKGYVPDIDPRFTVQYGRYLTDHVARCGFCHNKPIGLVGGGEEYLAGGKTITLGDTEAIAPDITNSPDFGIGGWTENDLVKYLQSGVTPGDEGRTVKLCPTDFYRNAPVADLKSIALYLKSISE